MVSNQTRPFLARGGGHEAERAGADADDTGRRAGEAGSHGHPAVLPCVRAWALGLSSSFYALAAGFLISSSSSAKKKGSFFCFLFSLLIRLDDGTTPRPCLVFP